MNKQQARNVVGLLQREPLFYRNFGVWWWHVKDEVKRHGYGPNQLYMLGDYTDNTTTQAVYAGLSPQERTQRALEHQADVVFHKRNVNTSLLPSDSGGGVYVLYDGDVE